MPLFIKPFVGVGVSVLFCMGSFFAGMRVQSRLPVPQNTSVPVGRDINKLSGLRPGQKYPPIEFDHNFMYPWSSWNLAGWPAAIPDNAPQTLFQRPAVFYTINASKERFIKSLKEQILINGGQIINGELHDKNGQVGYVEAPEIRRVFSKDRPEYLLAHVDTLWLSSIMRQRCRVGERLFHLTSDANGNPVQPGSELRKELFLQRFLEPVWQWRIIDDVTQMNDLPKDAL